MSLCYDRRVRFIPFVLLFTAACSDPFVDVSLEIPDDYRARVSQVLLSVLSPPSTNAFDCEAVAFGEVTDADLRGATRSQVSVTQSQGASVALTSIPRDGDKLFIAQGLGDDGLPIVAACEPLGAFDSDATVALSATPTAVAATEVGSFDDVLPATLDVQVNDFEGVALPGRDVRWSISSAAGGGALVRMRADESGRIAIDTTALPDVGGPVAISIRPKWSRGRPLTVDAFHPLKPIYETTSDADPLAPPNETELGPQVAAYRIGRLGPSGQPGVVVLGVPGTAFFRHVFMVYVDASCPDAICRRRTTFPRSLRSLGLITRGGRDAVFALTGSAWLELTPGATGLVETTVPMSVVEATNIMDISSCDSADIDRVLAQERISGTLVAYADGGLVVQSAFTQLPSSFFIVQSGCARHGSGDVVRAVTAIDIAAGAAIVAIDDDGTLRRGLLPADALGAGFVSEVGGVGPFVAASTFGGDGGSIESFLVVTDENSGELDLQAVSQIESPGIATQLAGGDLDGDAHADVASLMFLGDAVENRATRVAIGLGSGVTALSPQVSGARSAVALYDFVGAGSDQLLIGSTTGFGIYSLTALD